MTYKVPHYATVGISIMFLTEDGRIFSTPFSIDEIPEGGIEEAIAQVIAAAAGQGLRPMSVEEYEAWARELAAEHQRRRLAGAMRESATGRAIDPDRLDAILAAHKGTPGGDA